MMKGKSVRKTYRFAYNYGMYSMDEDNRDYIINCRFYVNYKKQKIDKKKKEWKWKESVDKLVIIIFERQIGFIIIVLIVVDFIEL